MDRRWSTRKHLPLRMTLEVPRHTGPVETQLRDISLSGAFVETRFLLPYHPLMVTFKLPESRLQESIRLEAKVVHRSSAGAGLIFLRTSTRVIRALSEALSRIPLAAVSPRSRTK